VIHPLQVWDGDLYDADAKALNPEPMNQWGSLSPGMRRKRWDDTVRALAAELAATCRRAPAHDPQEAFVKRADPELPLIPREVY
jgi:hypothetical protein